MISVRCNDVDESNPSLLYIKLTLPSFPRGIDEKISNVIVFMTF